MDLFHPGAPPRANVASPLQGSDWEECIAGYALHVSTPIAPLLTRSPFRWERKQAAALSGRGAGRWSDCRIVLDMAVEGAWGGSPEGAADHSLGCSPGYQKTTRMGAL